MTFALVFSGLSLSGADTLFALLIPFAMTMLWILIGAHGAEKYREDLADFLGAYMPRRETALPLAFFIAVNAALGVVSFFDTVASFGVMTDFLPFPAVFFVILGTVLVISRLGTTVLGRLSETTLFLLVPLIVLCLFGPYRSVAAIGTQSDWRLLFAVLPSPVFYMTAMSAVAGDGGATDSLNASARVPRRRAGFVCGAMIGGAALAVFVRLFVLLSPLEEDMLLFRFLEYSSHMVKLSLLLNVCLYGARRSTPTLKIVVSALSAIAATVAVGVAAGAIFSPFYLMLVLSLTSAAAALTLGIFSVR
jgi:fumarate reductase subunit C